MSDENVDDGMSFAERKRRQMVADQLDREQSDFTPEQRQTLANITPGNSLVPRQGTSIAECPTSLDLTKRRGKALALAAMSPSDLSFDNNGQVKIRVTDYIIFPDTGVNQETGEVSEFSRLVFFDRLGTTYRTTSDHAAKRLKAMLQLFSPEEWQEGIDVTIVERKSKKTGRTYHDIRVALLEEEDE